MNKVAFITGAGGCLDSETALTLAQSGISVAVCDINADTIKKTVERITEAGGVAPGIVMRPGENNEHRAYNTNLFGKKCTPQDIAALVAFLVSDKANFITGQTYVIDGGRTLSMKGTD